MGSTAHFDPTPSTFTQLQPVRQNQKTGTSRGSRGKTALANDSDCTEEMIRTILEQHRIETNPSLTAQVLKFTNFENRQQAFFSVNRVAQEATWGSENYVNTLTFNGKPVYVWIVGFIASCRLYDHEKNTNAANISINILPIPGSAFVQAKQLLNRVCGADASNTVAQDKPNVISASRSMLDGSSKVKAPNIKPFLNVFDSRSGFNQDTKTENNRIPCSKIAAGDVVMVEALVTRQRVRHTSHPHPPNSRRQAQGELASYQAKFSLVDVMFLASGEQSNTKNEEIGVALPEIPFGAGTKELASGQSIRATDLPEADAHSSFRTRRSVKKG